MSHNIQKECPEFWSFVLKARKKTNELYSRKYLIDHIDRALTIRLRKEEFYRGYFSNIFEITDLNEFDALFNKLKSIPNFSKHVYNTCRDDVTAGLNLYRRFLVSKKNINYLMLDDEKWAQEAKIDIPDSEINEYQKLQPIKKKDLVKVEGKYTYPRIVKLVKMALKNVDYKCELNKNHETFIGKNGATYLEAHHLIPLSAQNDFEYSLDILPNIVCLCPTCHRKLHYGQNIQQILKKIFDERREKLIKCGINITFQELLRYYK